MKSFLYIAVFMLVSSGIQAQVPVDSAPEISAPPGGELVTEINLSESDILGMIKQAIPAFAQSAAGVGGEAGVFLKSIDLNTLAEAIQGVKAIRAAQFTLQPGTSPADITNFYQSQLSLGQDTSEWKRIFYDASTVGRAASVYSRGGQDFFGVGVDLKKNRAFVFRTVGFVDVPKIAAWGGQMLKFAAEMEAKKKAAAKPAAKPAPKPAPKATTPPKKPATAK